MGSRVNAWKLCFPSTIISRLNRKISQEKQILGLGAGSADEYSQITELENRPQEH